MDVEYLNLLITYRCPSQCEHCSYFAGPRGTGLMCADEVRRYLYQILHHPLKEVWVYGGEPFIYFEALVEIINTIGDWGVSRIGILTNGFWATEKGKAVKMISLLKEAGLTDLVVSVDGFHAEYIHPDLAINALKAGVEAGIDTVKASTTFIRAARFPNSFDETSQEILHSLSGIAGIEVHRAEMSLVGRAADGLWGYCKTLKDVSSAKCVLPDYIGGDLKDPKGLEIDPFGWVQLCPGIGLGNTSRRPLDEIISEYDYNRHPIISRISQDGPGGLLPIARECGYIPREEYVDQCHLCFDIRKFLRPYYQGELTLRGYCEFR